MHPVPGGCSMSILGHDGKRYYQDGSPGQMMKGDGCLVMLLLFCVKPVAILILLFGLSRSKPEKRWETDIEILLVHVSSIVNAKFFLWIYCAGLLGWRIAINMQKYSATTQHAFLECGHVSAKKIQVELLLLEFSYDFLWTDLQIHNGHWWNQVDGCFGQKKLNSIFLLVGFGVAFYPSHFVQLVPGWPQGGDGCGVFFEKLPAAGGPRVLPKVGRTPQESRFLHLCSFLMLIYIYIHLMYYCIYVHNVCIYMFLSIEYIHCNGS